MKVDLARYKIWEATSGDGMRPVLCDTYADVEGGVLVATDSYCLAVVPAHYEDDDVSGRVPVAALKLAYAVSKSSRMGSATLALRADEIEVKTADGRMVYKRPQDGTYPDYKKLLGSLVEPVIELGLNAKILARLGEALGAGTSTGVPLRVSPHSPHKAIGVKGFDEAYGIVMPIRLVTDPHRSFMPDFARLLGDQEKVAAAAEAHAKMMRGRKGKGRAYDAFMDVLTALPPRTPDPVVRARGEAMQDGY